MQNYKKIANRLREELSQFLFLNAKISMKELEVILQTNIAADETRLENNEPLVCVVVNEEIKDVIFNATLEIEIRTKTMTGKEPVKVYLDDKRTTLDGYIRAFWPAQVITFLEELDVSEVSLDHDLGDDDIGTGNDVVLYIEEKVYFNPDWNIPVLKTHTDNSSAREKMQKGIQQIHKMKKTY